MVPSSSPTYSYHGTQVSSANASNYSSVVKILCPAGYYCPAGSTLGTDNPCPATTFSPLFGPSRCPHLPCNSATAMAHRRSLV